MTLAGGQCEVMLPWTSRMRQKQTDTQRTSGDTDRPVATADPPEHFTQW